MTQKSYFFIVSLVLANMLAAQSLKKPTVELYMVPTSTMNGEIAWSTEPGVRYELQESTNLNQWAAVPEASEVATTLVQQQVIQMDSSARRFFRVCALDEQPPQLISSTPSEESFGVRRFSEIKMELFDASGIDSASFLLTLEGRTFSSLSPEVTWSNNVFTLNLGGDVALGGYGMTQQVTLAVADVLGNATNFIWHFEMEQEINPVANLFVFGSPNAQRAGQRLRGVSATVASGLSGPLRMSSSSSDWEIGSVTTNQIVLVYSGVTAPLFTVGQFLANLAPAHESEIFYRRIDSLTDDIDNKTLTLKTTEVLLADILENGSFSFGQEEAIFLEFDENGTLVSANFDGPVRLPVIGGDFSGTPLWSEGALVSSLDEGVFTITPQLDVSLKNEGKSVERFEAKLSAIVNISCVPQITVSGSFDKALEKNLWRKNHWYWTSIGAVPVGVKLTTTITAKADINLNSSAHLSGGFRKHGNLWVKGIYVRGISSEEGFDRGYDSIPVEEVPLVLSLDGSCSVVISLVPQIDCRLYGCAGVYLNADPRLEITGAAQSVNGELQNANVQVWARANVNAGLSVFGFANDELPSLPFTFYEQQLAGCSVVATDPLQISAQSRSQSVKAGNNISLFVEAAGGTGIYSYQWFHNGQRLPGETGSRLYLNRVTSGLSGSYFVEIVSGIDNKSSEEINLSVVQDNCTGATFGMVLIPGGTNSGTDPDFGDYSLTADTFFMDATEITGMQWNAVRMKALALGYNTFFTGGGGLSSLPARGLTWRDCLAWCNARSELEGKMPCYWLDGMPYRGETNAVPQWEFFADGYRLPTQEEWEYAARGGLCGKRFPWGDTISHEKASYYSISTWDYDVSSTRGYHPVYTIASPAGSFKSNGYGLYDMTGNVAEWCWDESSLGSEMQFARGGAYPQSPFLARCGHKGVPRPVTLRTGYIGFRTVCR